MAYKYIARYSCADRATCLTQIWTMLSGMGWTLEDNQDGSSYRIYSSDGEAGDRIKEFIQFRWDTADQFNLRAWYRWNGGSITAGQGSAYWTNTRSYTVTSEDGFYFWMHGDKNIFVITTKVGTTYYQFGGGHLPRRHVDVLAEFQNAETSGSDKVVEVDNVYGFVPGGTYMVVGSSDEGRFRVTVDAVSDPDPYGAGTLTIASLNTGYAAGTLIGHSPSTFGIITQGLTYHQLTCTTHTSYDVLSNITTAWAGASPRFDMLDSGKRNPDYRTGLYAFTPVTFYVNDYTSSNAAYQSMFGSIDQHILDCDSNINDEDIFTVNNKVESTVTASATDNTLTDSGASWTVNEHSGRAVIVRFGLGVGQVRKIVSNTATVLTLDSSWVVPIDTTSSYIISDAAYRYLDNDLVLREGY